MCVGGAPSDAPNAALHDVFAGRTSQETVERAKSTVERTTQTRGAVLIGARLPGDTSTCSNRSVTHQDR